MRSPSPQAPTSDWLSAGCPAAVRSLIAPCFPTESSGGRRAFTASINRGRSLCQGKSQRIFSPPPYAESRASLGGARPNSSSMEQPNASARRGRIELGGFRSPFSHIVTVLELLKPSSSASCACVIPRCCRSSLILKQVHIWKSPSFSRLVRLLYNIS